MEVFPPRVTRAQASMKISRGACRVCDPPVSLIPSARRLRRALRHRIFADRGGKRGENGGRERGACIMGVMRLFVSERADVARRRARADVLRPIIYKQRRSVVLCSIWKRKNRAERVCGCSVRQAWQVWSIYIQPVIELARSAPLLLLHHRDATSEMLHSADDSVTRPLVLSTKYLFRGNQISARDMDLVDSSLRPWPIPWKRKKSHSAKHPLPQVHWETRSVVLKRILVWNVGKKESFGWLDEFLIGATKKTPFDRGLKIIMLCCTNAFGNPFGWVEENPCLKHGQKGIFWLIGRISDWRNEENSLWSWSKRLSCFAAEMHWETHSVELEKILARENRFFGWPEKFWIATKKLIWIFIVLLTANLSD